EILCSTITGAIRYPMFQGEQEIIQKQFELLKKENPDLIIHLLDDKGIGAKIQDSVIFFNLLKIIILNKG
ncbi:MAG: hypothetical protein L6416_10835, partial [Candidatus Omnitrophica bacterium]|nr:hypothetical protein [Candidatus Omnitrophota bacterium]